MQTVAATLVSKSKDGKRAMVIVRGEVDGKPYTATRHVERQGKNGPFIGANPDPRATVERQKARERVHFAWQVVLAAEKLLEAAQEGNEHKDKVPARQMDVNRAKAMYEVAKRNQQEAEEAFPLQVQFTF
jgi:hypothetical protein